MEAQYSKLLKKYATLKKQKESQFDKLNHDQEVKFLNFAAAADEMIQFLKSENDKLCGQVDELRIARASIISSSDEQCIHYQKLLTQERKNNRELSEEIFRLQKVEHGECWRCSTCKETGHGLENSYVPPVEATQGISLEKPTRKRKSVHISEGTSVPYVDAELDRPSYLVSKVKSNGAPSIQQPACCQLSAYISDTSCCSCMFQLFVEFVVGLKVSPLIKSKEQSMQAHHQSSGYTFSLTWISNSNGEVELLYEPLSLGTFERVALEWMKETLMFSTSMCPVFLHRVSRLINT